MDLDGKIFKALSNTGSGEVDGQTVFTYHQEEDLVWAEYSGGRILKGHLLGKWNEGKLEINYHHINLEGRIMAGKCISVPESLDDGRLKLNEKWRWYNGDQSVGTSEIVEVI